MTKPTHSNEENDRIYIHENSGVVFYKGKEIGSLGVTERKLLIFLISKNGSEASKDELTEAGWNNRVTVPNSLNMAIRKIRLFFNERGFPGLIMTIPKYGFSLPTPEIFTIFTHEEFESEINVESNKKKSHNSVPHVNKKLWNNKFFLLILIFLISVAILTIYTSRGNIKNKFTFPRGDSISFYSLGKCSFRSYGAYTQRKYNVLIKKAESLISEGSINCDDEYVDIFIDVDGNEKTRPLITLISYCYLNNKNQYNNCDNFRTIYAK